MKTDRQSRLWTGIGAALVLVWAGAFGWYFYQHMPVFRAAPGLADGETAAAGEEFREEWMGLYQGESKIGYNHSILYRTEDGYVLQDEMLLRLKLMGETKETRVRLDASLGADWSIREFEIEALSDFMDFAAEGRVQGKQIKLKVRTGGQEVEQAIAVAQTPYLYTTWMFAEELKRRGLEAGLKSRFGAFDPVSQTFLPVELEVVSEEQIEIHGEVIDAFKVRESFRGQEQWLWLGRDGEVLKESHVSGFMSLRETREQALEFAEGDEGAVDLITTLMVKANTALVSPREIKFMRARLKDISIDGLDLDSDRQAADGNLIIINSQHDRIPYKGYGLPFGETFPDRKDEFAEYLESDVSVQSDHPKILKAAERAARGEKDAKEVARKLTEWVSDEVRDSVVVSIPSALEVLEKKRGVCREHTVLYVALARALGLPARIAMGIVYSDEQLIDGFYYHAWPEVYLARPDGSGGEWIAVDPTFNQFPADATHIRLVEGGIDQVADLMGVIGQLEVEIEEYN